MIIIDINVTKGLIIFEHTPRNTISVLSYNLPVVDPLPETNWYFRSN